MIIMKFGGSSVKDAGRIQKVRDIVKDNLDKKPVLVFSAMGKTTDLLIEAGNQALQGEVDVEPLVEHHKSTCSELGVPFAIVEQLLDELKELLQGIASLKELSPKTSDYLVSFGERLSVRVIAAYMEQTGIKAKAIDAWEVGLLTNSSFTEAEVENSSYPVISESLGDLKSNYSYTPVVTGFIAKDKNGSITTLGRGGSDLTASVLGAALNVDEIQVWKDVDGILTTDPRIVSDARPVPSISFEQAAELAYFGAKVLHPLSMQPAMATGIPVRVKNSYNPQHPGSVIVKPGDEEVSLVKAITCKRPVTVVDLASMRILGQHGFLARVFSIFDKAGISVDMLATSEVSVSLTLNDASRLPSIRPALEEVASVIVQENKSIISLVGAVSKSSEILDGVFSVLQENNINVQMISQGASKVNIGFVVDEDQTDTCLQKLHQHFFEEMGKAA